MPLPLTVSCFSKIQIGFTFLVPAHPGSPGKRAIKRVCVCVCWFLAPQYMVLPVCCFSLDCAFWIGSTLLTDVYSCRFYTHFTSFDYHSTAILQRVFHHILINSYIIMNKLSQETVWQEWYILVNAQCEIMKFDRNYNSMAINDTVWLADQMKVVTNITPVLLLKFLLSLL